MVSNSLQTRMYASSHPPHTQTHTVTPQPNTHPHTNPHRMRLHYFPLCMHPYRRRVRCTALVHATFYQFLFPGGGTTDARCGPLMMWDDSASPCQPTCADPTASCDGHEARCVCVPCHPVRHNGECIEASDCP